MLKLGTSEREHTTLALTVPMRGRVGLSGATCVIKCGRGKKSSVGETRFRVKVCKLQRLRRCVEAFVENEQAIGIQGLTLPAEAQHDLYYLSRREEIRVFRLFEKKKTLLL